MLIEHLNRQLRERESGSLTRRRQILDSPCGPRADLQGSSLLAFCSNDYLGLANDPHLSAAMAEGAMRWGVGSGASHLISGHLQPHDALEHALAEFLEPCVPQARALSFSTGYLSNLALVTALGAETATIFADKLNHASLVDGALLARAPLQRYAHGRLDVLEARLQQCTTPIKLIVTDAVFSMDGDIADLPALLAIAERHDAWLIIDDAHGFGVLGAQGRGAVSHFGLSSERIILMGTLGKAAGVAGAFVVAHPTVIEWLIQTARPYIYTTAAPPAVAHTVLASLELIRGKVGERQRTKLAGLIRLLREQLSPLIARGADLGWRMPDSQTAIQPLIVGNSETALWLSSELRSLGLWVPAVRPPTVPAGTARLRISLSAAHDESDIEQLVSALAHAMEMIR